MRGVRVMTSTVAAMQTARWASFTPRKCQQQIRDRCSAIDPRYKTKMRPAQYAHVAAQCPVSSTAMVRWAASRCWSP